MSYMSAQETASAYDFWSACWLMSVALCRNVVIPRPRAPIYFNWYMVFTAESGVTRKSTAVRLCEDICRLFLATPDAPEFLTVQSKVSTEKFEADLDALTRKTNKAYAIVSSSELMTFLGREQYIRAMPGLLTDLYDSQEVRVSGGTIGRGTIILRNIFISFLSATTPTWLASEVNPDVVEGGFTSRCLFIVSEHRKASIPWPVVNDADMSQRESIAQELFDMHKKAEAVKRIELGEGGMAAYVRWYKRRITHSDPFRASFESREDAHMLRLAGCLAVNRGAWVIDAVDVRRAIEVIQEVKNDGARLFEGTGTTGRLVLGIDRLRDDLLASGVVGVTQSTLSARLRGHLDATMLRAVLELMHELGYVQRFDHVKVSERGRHATMWRATKELALQRVVGELIERITGEIHG